MTWSRATAIAGSAVVTLACCRIRIVPGHREPPETAELADTLAGGSMGREIITERESRPGRLGPLCPRCYGASGDDIASINEL